MKIVCLGNLLANSPPRQSYVMENDSAVKPLVPVSMLSVLAASALVLFFWKRK